jgi:hypothetical protein
MSATVEKGLHICVESHWVADPNGGPARFYGEGTRISGDDPAVRARPAYFASEALGDAGITAARDRLFEEQWATNQARGEGQAPLPSQRSMRCITTEPVRHAYSGFYIHHGDVFTAGHRAVTDHPELFVEDE